MGCCASQDHWNEYSDEVILDFQEWAVKIVDDILVWAETLSDLDERVRRILSKCRERGITISRKKLSMGTKVKFAGYIVSQQGIQPDPEKVQCLEQFPTPTDEKGLRSFLGLANQLGNFIPDLSQATKKCAPC